MHSARQERAATDGEDHGAEYRGDGIGTPERELVAEPFLHHLRRHDHRNRQQQVPPEQPSEHLAVRAVTGVPVMPGVGVRSGGRLVLMCVGDPVPNVVEVVLLVG